MMPMMRSNNWIPAVFNDLFDTDYLPKVNAIRSSAGPETRPG